MQRITKQLKQFLQIGVLSVFVTGCTTTHQIIDMVSDKPDYSQLFLRGSFTWWEADPQYQVQNYANNQYSVAVELVADGQPYEFKFADENWSPGLSCGYKSKENDEILELGRIVDANCDTPVDNFKFTPPTSGKYLFIIDFSGWTSPEVKVVRI